ncbi:MAG TPA: alpha/beta hydrolase-fold protein, partial [Bryobacteraceae bacterium]|nr:alpha/beta hydrolase-fold protein [Bryobacteraceae bacterium]
MRRLLLSLVLALAVRGAEPLIRDETHESRVFGETRHYRIFLPPDYTASGKRYPVIYWFHGWSERYNKPVARDPGRNYDQGEGGVYGGDTIARFVGSHDVIVVKWDGYNPRTPGETYLRPYNISPVETDRQFPLYFPELVAYIDSHYRTIADREHRATAGLSMGGFMSFWVAGKYPDLVGSASNFMGSSEFFVGPRGFPVEYRHDEMHNNYDSERTRLVMGTRDFIRFYHARMNAIWKYTRPFHETAEFDSDHGTPHMGETLEFHMRAFADPLPRPDVWRHIDAYPDFAVWGWEIASDRKQPGLTLLEGVSPNGFRSSVREWAPSGRVRANVKLRIASGRLYPAGQPQVVTVIRARDGKVRRATEHADSEGRLHFELDGDEYQVGVGPGAILALGDFEVQDGRWATDGKPVSVRVRVWNKGAASTSPALLRWETPNPNLAIATPSHGLPAIGAGKSADVALKFTVDDPQREVAKLYAVVGTSRLPIEIPMFPDAPAAKDFRIADGREFTVYQGGIKPVPLTLGKGNGDGQANPGEMLAILLPDGDAWRATEL